MAGDKDEIEGEEVRWERADQAIDRIHKEVETEYGPVYLSKHMRDVSLSSSTGSLKTSTMRNWRKTKSKDG